MKLVIHWLLATLAIIVTAYLLPGVAVSGILAAMITAAVLGLVNAFLKPVLLILTLPINILTLGLFTVVINVLLIWLTDKIVPGFSVSGFWGAVAFSIVLFFVNSILGAKRGR